VTSSAVPNIKHELIATNVCLQVGKRQLINSVSLTCPSGQWLQITGANGVGKSTLLRLLVGLTDADDGTILLRINGQSIDKRSARLLYQGHLHGFKDQLTVSENLRLQVGLDASGYQITGKDVVESNLNAAIDFVGLGSRVHLAFGKLSAGQKRRCMLARLAFAVNVLSAVKVCWILDEPLTALDAQAQQILSSLLSEHLSLGGSAVLATHQNLTELGLPQPIELNLSALVREPTQ
jgi:heme exporter protein A